MVMVRDSDLVLGLAIVLELWLVLGLDNRQGHVRARECLWLMLGLQCDHNNLLTVTLTATHTITLTLTRQTR